MPLLAIFFGWVVYGMARQGSALVMASQALSAVAMLVSWVACVRNFSLPKV